MLHCYEFVNADSIALGLSPFKPETVAIAAGRIMLHRINELIETEVDFAFETTLSTKSFVQTI
jgi:predicted ABC-type ATPase